MVDSLPTPGGSALWGHAKVCKIDELHEAEAMQYVLASAAVCMCKQGLSGHMICIWDLPTRPGQTSTDPLRLQLHAHNVNHCTHCDPIWPASLCMSLDHTIGKFRYPLLWSSWQAVKPYML